MAVRALILAAGRGSRLGGYTKSIPKCLLKLGGATLIERQLQTLRSCGVDDIIIITGYRADMLAPIDTRQIHNPDWATTNMVESLFAAEAEFTGDLIVAYGDIVYEPRILDALLDSDAEISVTIDRQWRPYWEHRFDDPLSDAESLRLNDAGHITDIGNTVDDMDEIQGQYLGLMRFRAGGIAALNTCRVGFAANPRPWMEKRPIQQAYMTDLLMELILTGQTVHAVQVDGGWLEIDTPKDFEQTVAMFADGTIRKFFNPDLAKVTT